MFIGSYSRTPHGRTGQLAVGTPHSLSRYLPTYIPATLLTVEAG